MKKTSRKSKQNIISKTSIWLRNLHIGQKILLGFLLAVIFWAISSYTLAFWYIQKHQNEPLKIGVTFIANYARYYDLDPEETLLALRDDLGFKRFRLVSYWKDIEKTPGQYDFTELDRQFELINEVNGEVSLSIGLRQPRWPECHAPDWVNADEKDIWYPELKNFMAEVINRYKDNPALDSYQLENEYFLGVFGECEQFGIERERLIDEFNLVKSLDTKTPVIISLSNNYLGIPVGEPRPDQFGVSVYKRVFDETITKRYFEYPFPSWWYTWRAALTEIATGKDSMLHELQTEPWAPGGVKDASLKEQSKSMDADRIRERINYGVDTGFRDIDLWGGEWWYWRKTVYNDPSLWEAVREEVTKQYQSQ